MLYNFKPDFASAVASGEKSVTLRAPRKGRSRHARVGDALQLSQGARTKAYRLLAETPCILRATVVLGPTGVVRVIDATTDKSPRAAGLAMLLNQAEQGAPEAARWSDALARLDGFPDYAAMWAWHSADDGALQDGRVTRELIGWGAF